jgi:farnesyl diphosphate synthase
MLFEKQMLFEKLLESFAHEIETHLDSVLGSQPQNGEIARPKRLIDAMRYALLGGGKRFRGFLVCESAKMLGLSHTNAIYTALSVECLHAYSLVHDDLPAMDDDDLRRGKPTVHKAFDEATAILAGDALQTLAFELLADPQTHPDANVRCALIKRFAQVSGMAGMVGGQMLDLAAEGRFENVQHSVESIRLLQSMKTGALIAYSAEAGAILAQVEARVRDALLSYGKLLGVIFQISDDLLDHQSTPEILGKATAKDAHKGKATLITLLGLEKMRALRDAHMQEALNTLSIFGSEADVLRQAIEFASHRVK